MRHGQFTDSCTKNGAVTYYRNTFHVVVTSPLQIIVIKVKS